VLLIGTYMIVAIDRWQLWRLQRELAAAERHDWAANQLFRAIERRWDFPTFNDNDRQDLHRAGLVVGCDVLLNRKEAGRFWSAESPLYSTSPRVGAGTFKRLSVDIGTLKSPQLQRHSPVVS
jgi:hypothetical protein